MKKIFLMTAMRLMRCLARIRPKAMWPRICLAHLLCNQGLCKNAVAAYEEIVALDLNDKRPEWQFRLGVAKENLGDLTGAQSAYLAAINRSANPSEYWLYRLAVTFFRLKEYKKSCSVFKNLGCFSPEFQSDFVIKSMGPISKAFTASLCKKSACLDKHDPKIYYALGNELAEAGRWEEAAIAFCNMLLIQYPYIGKRIENNRNGRALIYADFQKTAPIQMKTILYESFKGVSVSCNPLAIFLNLLERPNFLDWEHVWVLRNEHDIPDYLANISNVSFVIKDSPAYLRQLATAAYLVNNVNFPPYFIRRSEQKYINTWHGTPVKHLGRDIPYPPHSYMHAMQDFLNATHIIAPNRFTKEILLDRYALKNRFSGVMALTGYPRIDLMLKMTSHEKKALRRSLGVSEGQKILLYAPTWRGIQGKVRFDAEKLRRDMKKISSLSCAVVFRGHPSVEKNIEKLQFPFHVAGKNIETARLLSITDILVTDYSSIFFDFLPMSRPIFFYAYDLEDYQKERGLYFNMENLLGTLHKDVDLLVAEIEQILSSDFVPNKKYREAQKTFCPLDDGVATERVINLFFG